MTMVLRSGGRTFDAGDAVDHTEQLEQLARHVQKLERLRFAADTTARRVALDVELCRMEAARLMLSAPPHRIDALPAPPSSLESPAPWVHPRTEA